MIARLIGWLQAALAYWSGRRAGQQAVQLQELKQEDEVAHAVIQAQADAPHDRASVADRLRAGGF